MVADSGGVGEGIVRELGKVMYTLLYLKWITNKDLFYSTGNSAQRKWQPGREGGLGENGYMYILMWLNPFIVHLKLP